MPTSHNIRVDYYVNPEVEPLSESDVARFWAKVDRTSDCWFWTAARTGGGRAGDYGQFGWQAAPGRQVHSYAHRIAFALSHGPFPKSAHICHRCDTPLCVNPAHLFLGDQNLNNKDAAKKGRFHVPRPSRQKLTDDEVNTIVRLLEAGEQAVRLAERYGVSKSFVSRVKHGTARQWRRVA